MGLKDKLFGGHQNPQMPQISQEIVNPYYNISQDGAAQSSADNPGAAPNPFMQQLQQAPPNAFIQQQQTANQQAPQPARQSYPVIDNNQSFDIAQPDTPNGHYEATGMQQPQQQYDPQAYQQPQQQYDPQAYQQPQQQYAPQAYQQPQQQYAPQASQQPQQQYDPQAYQQPQQQYAPQAYQQPQQQYAQSSEQTVPVQDNPLLPPFNPENSNG